MGDMLALVHRAILRQKGKAYPKDEVRGKHVAFLLAFSLFNGSFYSQPPTETFFLSDPIKLLHRNLCQEGRGQRAIGSMTSHLRQCGGWTSQNTSEAQFPTSCLRVALQAPREEMQLSCGAWESLRSGDRDWELQFHKFSGRQQSEAAGSRPDQSVSLPPTSRKELLDSPR